MSDLSESRPLAGMAALVTGGAGGIGRSTARLLVADGAHVVIASRSAGHLQEVADDLGPLASEAGGSIRWTACNATDSDQVQAAVALAAEPTGRLDMAVSVPGGGAMAAVLDYEPEQVAETVSFNVVVPFMMDKAERERIQEHFARGRAFGETLTAAADHPAQVYRLALNALDTADLPMVQNDTAQVALLMGIVSACAEWIIASAKQGDMVDLIAADAEMSPEAVRDSLLVFGETVAEWVPGAVVAYEVNPN